MRFLDGVLQGEDDGGKEFRVEGAADGVLPVPVAPRRVTLDEVAGCLRRPGKAKSLAEMDAAVGVELEERRGRGRY